MITARTPLIRVSHQGRWLVCTCTALAVVISILLLIYVLTYPYIQGMIYHPVL